jgi:MFS transporter, DHA1 family, inner membrane transport protein
MVREPTDCARIRGIVETNDGDRWMNLPDLTSEARTSSPHWAEFALAVGGLSIGVGEFGIMGVLPDLARDLNISIPQGGYAISAYALGVVVGAPTIAVLAARVPRRSLLLGLMIVFVLGNIASALAPSESWLIALRFITGLPHGAYFGVASLVAASMAGVDGRAGAVARVMLGLTVATLVGTPLTTWFGDALGWRAAFATVGLIGAVSVLLICHLVPTESRKPAAGMLSELSALRHKQVWLTLGIGAIGFGGMFAVYSYIVPTLNKADDVSQAVMPFVLSIFGLGMILGNMVGSWLADRALMPTIGGVLAWNIVALALFGFTAGHGWEAIANVLLIGTGFALVPALQTRLMDVAAEAQTLAAALNHSAFNIANALGAWLGGLSIAAGHGWTSTGWVGALLAAGGAVVFAISLMVDRSVEHVSA